MSSPARIRRWFLVHQWSSLACTLFLLVLCVTGLPLVFHDDIDRWTSSDPAYAAAPADAPRASLDTLTDTARRRYPGQIVTSILIDDDEPQVMVYMAPAWKDLLGNPSANHSLKFDAHTGAVLNDSAAPGAPRATFMDAVHDLHTDLFAGFYGELLLMAVGLLFLVAIVSGVVLYGPFMKKIDFGIVRGQRARRLKWLDLHNLLGIVLLAWTLVVGATGIMNELSTPLFMYWQRTEVQGMLAPYRGKQAPPSQDWRPAQAVLDTARHTVPGMTVMLIFPPGNPFGSPYHYLVWAKGDSPLTSHLFTPLLVDARSDQVTDQVRMPPYLRTLEVSRPLHFGDYGGMPLKILWALLDLLTIGVLVSGLYLWLARRQATARRIAELTARHDPALADAPAVARADGR